MLLVMIWDQIPAMLKLCNLSLLQASNQKESMQPAARQHMMVGPLVGIPSRIRFLVVGLLQEDTGMNPTGSLQVTISSFVVSDDMSCKGIIQSRPATPRSCGPKAQHQGFWQSEPHPAADLSLAGEWDANDRELVSTG